MNLIYKSAIEVEVKGDVSDKSVEIIGEIAELAMFNFEVSLRDNLRRQLDALDLGLLVTVGVPEEERYETGDIDDLPF